MAGFAVSDDALPVSKEVAIESIMRDPAVFAKADLIPTSELGGRHRLHRNWEYILFNELISFFQTGGRVQTELGDPRTWGLVRELARELLPNDLQPPDQPMRWFHYKYVKNRYLARPDMLSEYRRVGRETSCALAREAGNFAGDGAAFTIHPTEAISTAADGKVVSTRPKARPGQRSRSRKTGKRVRKRVDPDKARYVEGDGEAAWGLKFLPVHTRTPYGRVILDIPYVKGVAPADEADVAVETLTLLRPHLPGPHYHVHDGAMTGKHNQKLLTELGTVLVNRPPAKSNPKVKGRAVGHREPFRGVVDRKVMRGIDGTEEVLEIHQEDGGLGLLELTETGDRLFTVLTVTKLHMNPNGPSKTLRFRPYAGLRLPTDIALRTGRREVTVALYETARDKKAGFPRAARVRVIGPTNPDFKIYRSMRNDSESLNRTVEDSLYRHHRAHSEGWARQQVDMLGLAGLINALTRERMRRALISAAA